MDPYGEAPSQKVLGINGQELEYSPLYERSLSIRELKISKQGKWRMSWAKRSEASEGCLRFVRDDERGCVQTNREFGRRFKGMFLEKVHPDNGYTMKSQVPEEFYPPLYRFLKTPQNWGTEFLFRGLASFMPCLMEWTEQILDRYGDILRQADIYGLVAISRFPYMYHIDVWRAFCELWGPLTNTLHHAGGELGISLHDLKQIAGLPILGEPYEEFLPPNEQLLNKTKFPPTVLELLRIHADLCKNLGGEYVSWWQWLKHFFRGKQIHDAFPKNPFVRDKRRGPNKQMGSSSKAKGVAKVQKQAALIVSDEGQLAAFIALLLSRFVFPSGARVIRPATFVMACFMAKGRKISLAPAVLGHIYHGMNKMATHEHPGRANSNFGLHFMIGWMAEYFPDLYHARPHNQYPKDYPLLARYAGMSGEPLNIHQARMILRHSKDVKYRAILFGDDVGADKVDLTGNSDQDFERLLCIRSSVLPVRVGGSLILEPYYPNRFARQFGFDQGAPTNSLTFSIPLRSRRSLRDIAQCYADLFRKDTGVEYHIPCSDYLGACTTSYCWWWVVVSTPYLSQSIQKVNTILTGKKTHLRENTYIITDLKEVITNLKGTKTSTAGSPKSDESSFQPSIALPMNKRNNQEQSLSDDVNFKRRKYKKSTDSYESDLHNKGYGNPDPISKPIFDVDVTSELKAPEESHLQERIDQNSSQAPGPIHSPSNVGDPRRMSTFENYGTIADVMETPFPATDRDHAALVVVPEVQHSESSQAPLDIMPLEIVPLSVHGMFSAPVKEHVRQAFVASVQAVSETMVKIQSAQSMLPMKDELLEDLATLKIMAKAAKINDLNLYWIVSQVHDFSEGIDTISKLMGTVDTTSLNKVSADIFLCKIELTSKEAELLQLHEKSSIMEKRAKDILDARAKLRQMEESFAADKEALEKSRSEVEQSIQIQRTRQENLEEVERDAKAKLEELHSKKTVIDGIVTTFTSFASSG